MDEELRSIASHRLKGMNWAQIAATMGGTGESRRKQYQRGLDRIARLVGIEDDEQLCLQ
jgi:hypothetical protein